MDELEPEKVQEILRYIKVEVKKGLSHTAAQRAYLQKREAYEFIRDLLEYVEGKQ